VSRTSCTTLSHGARMQQQQAGKSAAQRRVYHGHTRNLAHDGGPSHQRQRGHVDVGRVAQQVAHYELARHGDARAQRNSPGELPHGDAGEPTYQRLRPYVPLRQVSITSALIRAPGAEAAKQLAWQPVVALAAAQCCGNRSVSSLLLLPVLLAVPMRPWLLLLVLTS
jgi:hypothetical protein